MRIYTPAGDLAFSTMVFPDGQPHFKLETYEREFDTVVVEMAVKTPSDLFTLLLGNQVLRGNGYANVNLDIRYLMGARMDRSTSYGEPFTLETVARLINGAGFTRVRILDAHSEVATRLIRNATNILPLRSVAQAFISSKATVVVVPDKGATVRAQRIWYELPGTTIIYCEKTRDVATGALSGFKVNDYEPEKDGTSLMIVDDICDGGGTFVGLAKELRKAGAKVVNLFVTHGIFSKGLPLEGIDHIYTTDSYLVKSGGLYDAGHYKGLHVFARTTVIPISMKELK